MNTLRHLQRGAATFTMIAGLVIAVLFVYFLYAFATSGSKLAADDSSDIATIGRIQPTGVVRMSDGVPAGSRTGDMVFNKVCIQCHAADSKVAFSPKLGNTDEWAPRIAQGYDLLLQHATDGFKTMPARGGVPDLTDDEIGRAIVFMTNQSGANFVEPPVEDVAP